MAVAVVVLQVAVMAENAANQHVRTTGTNATATAMEGTTGGQVSVLEAVELEGLRLLHRAAEV